ncbi:hypothetical protein PR003_g4504 [Phytophthora rubi]|uniref:Glutathione peroxidase n=1 Tax=Phytophthora rubi TaxID=129364 RepID=A0A6A4G6A6_9STRA|nr:hypothetical protein PR003_g4504 [Phytophthora rubi]
MSGTDRSKTRARSWRSRATSSRARSRAEITEFAKQYDVTFLFFEKHNVNGATARPVFTNLKMKLLGSFGDFVKWNFTKFLVDRNGLPFAPKDHRKESDPEYTKQNPEYKQIFQNKFSIFDGNRGYTGGIGRSPSTGTI